MSGWIVITVGKKVLVMFFVIPPGEIKILVPFLRTAL